MANVQQLGYIGVEASNLKEWERFAQEVLGLQVWERGSDGSLFLRMDEYHHRIIVQPGPKDDLALMGWEVTDEGELEAMAQQLKAASVEVRRGTPEEAQARRVTALIKYHDPNGIASEIFYGPLVCYDEPFQSPRPISGFVTGTMGLGHCTMAADDLEQSLHFYRDVLGLKLSDWVQPQPERGVASSLNIAFFHCNPRHHTLAFWQGKMPKRIHHFMLQLRSVDDVGTTYDLCQDRGVPIIMTLGRHTNDHMVSFYLGTPSGFAVEYGWGAREVDDSVWRMQLHTTGSIWGHRLVKT